MRRAVPKTTKQQVPAPPPREPTEAERAALAAWSARRRERPQTPRFRSDSTPSDLRPVEDTEEAVFVARLHAATGAVDTDAMANLLTQVADTAQGAEIVDKVNHAVALLAGIGPRNELEGLLAVQMVGCHNLAMTMLGRATKTERVDLLALYGNLAAKLLRTFAMQTEALARLRGQTGNQTVRVEHVHVEAGGQAVVGAVTTPGGGCEQKS
jgi:hypothetical protein